jgi:hypothetical protein
MAWFLWRHQQRDMYADGLESYRRKIQHWSRKVTVQRFCCIVTVSATNEQHAKGAVISHASSTDAPSDSQRRAHQSRFRSSVPS